MITQKTVNATSNLISLGVSYATALAQKNSRDFARWSEAKHRQCTFEKDLSSDEIIDDFYYLPSKEGALDPQNLKFNGFTCSNYIETQNTEEPLGHDVFFVSCKLRTDSLGIARMANHSKFMLEVDSIAFFPKFCNIPNDNPKKPGSGFDFGKYTDLELELDVAILSSWVNEAVMVMTDEVLGYFTIRAKIDKDALEVYDGDTVFIYNGKNPLTQDLVDIIGESFIVPRSFVGTTTKPVWGTGQYKLEVEVTESCQLQADYYLKPDTKDVRIEEVGNGRAVNFANLPGYECWEKKVWKTEWKTMQHRDQDESFWKQLWKSITTAYIGDNWVKELVDPMATQLYDYEAKQLSKVLGIDNAEMEIPGNDSSKSMKPLKSK